jgi:hypothetical protein
MTCKTGSGLDEWIYCTSYFHNSGIQRCRCTLYSSPLQTHKGSQSSLVVSWQRIYKSLSLQIKHGVFFSLPNSFLAIILQLQIPKTRLNSILLFPSSYPGRLASRSSTLHSMLLNWILLYNHFARTPRKTPSYIAPYCFRRVYRRANLDEKRKNLPPARNETPAVQHVARRYTDWAIPVLGSISWPANIKISPGKATQWEKQQRRILETRDLSIC